MIQRLSWSHSEVLELGGRAPVDAPSLGVDTVSCWQYPSSTPASASGRNPHHLFVHDSPGSHLPGLGQVNKHSNGFPSVNVEMLFVSSRDDFKTPYLLYRLSLQSYRFHSCDTRLSLSRVLLPVSRQIPEVELHKHERHKVHCCVKTPRTDVPEEIDEFQDRPSGIFFG